MADTLVQEIKAESAERKISIYRRDNGTYYYEEAYFSQEADEEFWVPVKSVMIGIYHSQDIALREAIANVGWLRDQLSNI
jgi:hypothetical protein